MGRSGVHAVGALVALEVFAVAEPAAAADPRNFGTVGASLAVNLLGEGPKLGFGPAFNFAHHVHSESLDDDRSAIGAFLWSYFYPSAEGDLFRLGAGGQVSYSLLGLEIGPSVMFGHYRYADLTHDVRQGDISWTPFLSAGFVWVGLRANMGNVHSDIGILEFVAGAGYPIGFRPSML